MHSSGVCCIGVCGVFLLLVCLYSGAVPDAAATSLLIDTTLKSSLRMAPLKGRRTAKKYYRRKASHFILRSYTLACEGGHISTVSILNICEKHPRV
jgi:hypothetical protein